MYRSDCNHRRCGRMPTTHVSTAFMLLRRLTFSPLFISSNFSPHDPPPTPAPIEHFEMQLQISEHRHQSCFLLIFIKWSHNHLCERGATLIKGIGVCASAHAHVCVFPSLPIFYSLVHSESVRELLTDTNALRAAICAVCLHVKQSFYTHTEASGGIACCQLLDLRFCR